MVSLYKRIARKGWKKHLKAVARKKAERRRKAGFDRFLALLRNKNNLLPKSQNLPNYQRSKYYASLGQKPKFNDWIHFLSSRYERFSELTLPDRENGILVVPRRFSISENEEESMYFMKRLFHVLLKQNVGRLIIDYQQCEFLDVDASAFMDLILAGFIHYYRRCEKKRHLVKIQEIRPINYGKQEVFDILFGIGAYANLKGFKLEKEGVLAFRLRIGDKTRDTEGRLKEIHETEIVDYVIECLNTMGRGLTPDAEANLSKVVGEVMANAEEHSNFRYRFAIGYFKKDNIDENNSGLFKLVIFNFGQTIYESFKRPDCPNTEIVNQMKDLSQHYTKQGWFGIFGKRKFEEQTLWTLYALQERVTSMKDWRRGNGSIRFIDRFFRLKGNVEKDNQSKLTLISGNSRIIFDGTYPLIDVKKGDRNYKMMTFNEFGDISQLPDKDFVIFANEFFPGTMISAKICIAKNSIEIAS